MTATLGGTPVTIHLNPAESPPPGLLGLDVESRWMTDRAQFDENFRVRTVQFGTTDTAYVYDLDDMTALRAAKAILLDPAYEFCSHTNMDVLSVFVQFGIDISERNIDTRMLAIIADPDKGSDRDLKTLTTRYIGPELAEADAELYAWMVERWVANGGRKNAAKAAIEEDGWNALAEMPADEWPEVFTRYAGLDAVACRRLLEPLIVDTELGEQNAETLIVDQWLAVRANRIQMRGLRVDEAELTRLLDDARTKTSQAEMSAKNITGGITLRSPKLQAWLSHHGVDWSTWPGALTPKGVPSLAKENAKLIGEYPLDDEGRAVFDALMNFRASLDMLNKCEGMAARLTHDTDGTARLHPLLNTVGATTTARMSSSGPNLQNMSKKNPLMRGMFLPDPGHELWTIDFDQVELRVVAALAREQKMIDTVLAGGDLHWLTVHELAAYGVTITRQVAKITNFLIVYGGGGGALHEQANIPLDIAHEVVRGIRERYPAIDALSKYMGLFKDEVRTISGRRLKVTEDFNGRARTYANVNYLVQSSARELLADAWMRFETQFGHEGVVWWPVHDELVLQVPVGEHEQIIADAERAMTFDFMGVPISASAIRLLDREGVSRWMPGDIAEDIAKEKAK